MRKALVLILSLVLISVLVLCAIQFPRAVEVLEGQALDVFFRIRGPLQSSGDVVIVAFDSRSLDRFGRWPWPRDRIAFLLERICAGEPDLVAFDVTFSQNETNDEDVRATDSLAAAASRCGRVLFPYYFVREDRSLVVNVAEPPADIGAMAIDPLMGLRLAGEQGISQAKQLSLSSDRLTHGKRAGGHLSKVIEADGCLRREAHLIRFGPAVLPSLALTVVARRAASPSPIQVRSSRELAVAGMSVPLDEVGCSYLNYYGPAGSFPQLSAADVIEESSVLSKLKGRIVLVGLTAEGYSDIYDLPFSKRLPTVEKLATSIDNILTHRWLVRQPGYEKWELLVLMIVVLGAGALLWHMPLRKVIPIYGIASLILFASSYACFAFRRVWIETATAAFVPWMLLILLFAVEKVIKSKSNPKN